MNEAKSCWSRGWARLRKRAGDEIGIDRSNLTRESEAVQEKTLQDIHALGMPHGSGMCFQERHRKLWPHR
jgi:hypothetical protein